MNGKEKLKSKSFWVSLASAVFVLLQAFGLKIDLPYVNEIVASLLGVLVILGIVSDHPSSGGGAGDGGEGGDDQTD